MHKNGIKIAETDNVVTVMQNVDKMDEVFYRTKTGDKLVISQEKIPQFHKLACRRLSKGDTVIKYGEPIGAATTDIEIGGYVHIHDLKSMCMVEGEEN